MTARDYQSSLLLPVKGTANARGFQAFVQVIASLEPAVSVANNYQSFIQVIARTYKITKAAEPGHEIVRVGVHNGFALLTMGSMNED